MIPAGHALRASLALKLWSIERKSHVMALVADEGLALFCGLNAMPKKSFLSEYSSRITPQKVSRLLGRLARAARPDETLFGRRVPQPRLPLRALLRRAPASSNRTICPSAAAASPASSPSWPRTPTARSSAIPTPISARARKPRRSSASSTSGSASTARLPQHLVFDSKLTTYDRLDRLDAAGITFITLRRRSPSLLAEIDHLPPSAWRTVNLDISSRKHRTPRVYEQKARPHKRDLPAVLHHRSRPRRAHHPAHQ